MATVLATKFKAGKSYSADLDGAKSIEQTYQVILSEPLGENEVPTAFPGVPALGSTHPTRTGLAVLSYDVSQPDGSAKNTLEVKVKYGPASIEVTPPGEEPEVIEVVKEWGWDDGTGDKELVSTVDTPPKPVLNSAQDPFDSVPTVSVPTPTFTKVILRSRRQSDYTEHLCTTNDRELVIGAMTCEAGTLLCTVAERRIIGDAKFPYEYTIHLRYRSNIVPDQETGAETEIGWDAAVTDAGMREIDDNGKLKLIQVLSQETGQPANVTAPELLDGQGHAVTRGQSGQATPIVLTFRAYKRTTFPDWFYSEPPVPTNNAEDEEEESNP